MHVSRWTISEVVKARIHGPLVHQAGFTYRVHVKEETWAGERQPVASKSHSSPCRTQLKLHLETQVQDDDKDVRKKTHVSQWTWKKCHCISHKTRLSLLDWILNRSSALIGCVPLTIGGHLPNLTHLVLSVLSLSIWLSLFLSCSSSPHLLAPPLCFTLSLSLSLWALS